MQPAVTVVGETLIDVVQPTSGPAREHLGGSPANVAVGLARLGYATRLATQLGDDRAGRWILDQLRTEGVDVSDSSRTIAPTSTALARLDASGGARYEFDLRWAPDLSGLGPLTGQHLHVGSIGAMLSPGVTDVLALVRAERPGSTISYDPNIRPALAASPSAARSIVEQFVAVADVTKASAEDIEWLYPRTPLRQVLADWAALGCAVVIATQGADETIVLAAGELSQRRPLPSPVVDTVGAGDSFMAGAISGLLDGGFLGDSAARERLRFAHFDHLAAAVDRGLTCAAITVSRAGANPPTRAELAIQD